MRVMPNSLEKQLFPVKSFKSGICTAVFSSFTFSAIQRLLCCREPSEGLSGRPFHDVIPCLRIDCWVFSGFLGCVVFFVCFGFLTWRRKC